MSTTRRVRSPLSLPLVALLALRALPAAPANTPSTVVPPTPSQYEESADVVEVEVPVHVQDKDGHPVRGLTVADFRVRDNGQEQEIADFRVVDLDQVGGDPRQVEQLPGAVRRHFLFLFDFSFSDPTSVLKARLAARDFVAKGLHPADLAAVATFSLEQGPRLILSFTPDRIQVAHAIDTLGIVTNPELAVRDPLRLVITPPGLATNFEQMLSNQQNNSDIRAAIQDAAFEQSKALARQFERSEKGFERTRIKSWSRSFADFAGMLRTVQGSKHLLYFSEGFDSRLLLGRQPNLTDNRQAEDNNDITSGNYWMVDSDDLHGSTELQGDIGRMVEEFRRADVIIQSVDIGGLSTELDATQMGEHHPGADGLFLIANDTGGRLFENANDLASELGKVMESTSTTYLLTLRPKNLKADGKYHKLVVEVPNVRGARVSARAGYYAPRPFEDLHPMERNLLASEAIAAAAPQEGVGLHLLAAPFRSGDGPAYVPVILEVDGKSLLQGAEDGQLGLEIYAYASNNRGEMVDFFSQMVGLDLGQARAAVAASGVKYYGHLELQPGDYLLRVMVRNSATGRTGLTAQRLHVPAQSSAPRLLPPFFFEDPGKWVMVREKQATPSQGSVVYPFVVEGEPYVPAARPVLLADGEARMCLVAYNLGATGELSVGGRVLDNAGTLVGNASLAEVRRTVTGLSGVERLVATFRPSGLPPGDYSLEIAVTDPQTGQRQLAVAPFAVAR